MDRYRCNESEGAYFMVTRKHTYENEDENLMMIDYFYTMKMTSDEDMNEERKEEEEEKRGEERKEEDQVNERKMRKFDCFLMHLG